MSIYYPTFIACLTVFVSAILVIVRKKDDIETVTKEDIYTCDIDTLMHNQNSGVIISKYVEVFSGLTLTYSGWGSDVNGDC